MPKSDYGLEILLYLILFGAAMLLFPYWGYAGIMTVLYVALFSLVGMILYLIFRAVRNRCAPVRTLPTIVLRKHSRDGDMAVQMDGPNTIENLGMMGRDSKAAWDAYSKQMRNPYRKVDEVDLGYWTDFLVTFSCDGKELEFFVPESVYAELGEGDEGILTFQGDLFKRFASAKRIDQDQCTSSVTQG